MESSIIYSVWNVGRAYGGYDAAFEVRTAFVGEGAKIKIKGKSEAGKNLGKISDVIYGNQFIGRLAVPDNIKEGDFIFFEVELSQLSLKDESNHIPAGPPIIAKNMKWDKSEARRGDVVKLTADLTGVPNKSDARVLIMEYDHDDAHDKIAEIPTVISQGKLELLWEYEYHADTDEIPTHEELQKYGKKYNHPEYFFIIEIDGIQLGTNQESGLLLFKDYVEIELRNEEGDPAANAKYTLHLADGSQRQGQLDSYGRAREEDIPPGEMKVEFPDFPNFG
jgi:hypothetical protein